MQVPQAVVVEGGRPVLLVARVRRDQEERTVVEAVALVPDTALGRIHSIRRGERVLMLLLLLARMLVRRALSLTLLDLLAGGVVPAVGRRRTGEVQAVGASQVKLVVPFAFEVRVERLGLLLVHELVHLARWSSFEIWLV